MNYEEQVKALRHCMTKEDGITICEPCPYYGKGIECENVLHTDAAAAIEELEAEIRESMQKCAECGDRCVEVVRCRECRWGHLCVTGQHLGLDGFCSKGEREVQDGQK